MKRSINLNHDWEFNVFGVNNFRRPGPYQNLYDFIRANHAQIRGDIVEAGVFRGNNLLALGLLLKELGSDKTVYGFDTFSGFPDVYGENDRLEMFDQLHESGVITEEHYEQVRKNFEIKGLLGSHNLDASLISTNGDFSSTDVDVLRHKIELLGLDNIRLIEGTFADTMAPDQKPSEVFCCSIDCDLYESYLTTLAFVWPRLVAGGMVRLDEYFSLKFPGARLACDEFFVGKNVHLEKTFNEYDFGFERWHAIKPVDSDTAEL